MYFFLLLNILAFYTAFKVNLNLISRIFLKKNRVDFGRVLEAHIVDKEFVNT